MQYALIIYEGEDDFQARSDPARQAAYWQGWTAYSEAVKSAGILRGGAGLQGPDTGTTLRNGHVQDGPYADAKEQLGGFYTIDVPDLDTAMQWARRIPVTKTGVVEVRPLLAIG